MVSQTCCTLNLVIDELTKYYIYFLFEQSSRNYQEEIVTLFKKKIIYGFTLCFCTVVGIET